MDIYTFSRINRFRKIIFTLLKYGFEDILARLDLPEKVFPKRIKRYIVPKSTTWERIRFILEELGPTFIKLGQILSLRVDLLPFDLIKELSKLQDEVPYEEFEVIKKEMEKTYKRPVEEIFSHIDPVPVAAASIAQVHRGVLKKNNRDVAIKIQRPNIKQIIRIDLSILENLAKRVHEKIEFLKPYNLPELVDEIKKMFFQELNFTKEAKNILLAKKAFKDNPKIYLPEVYLEFSSSNILVMEYIEGKSLKEIKDQDKDFKKEIAKICVEAIVKQMLVDGFFHADPHPGNILITKDKKVCFLDWGIIGRLTEADRLKISSLLDGIIKKDGEIILTSLLSLSQDIVSLDKDLLLKDVMEILDYYYILSLRDINLVDMVKELVQTIKEHNLKVRIDLSMMFKSLITLDGTTRTLYPDINLIEEFSPYVKRLLLRKYRPDVIYKHLRHSIYNIWQFQKKVPFQITDLLSKLEKDNLTIVLEHKRLENLIKSIERSANKLTLGVVIGAMVIASSMIITTGVKPLLFGYSALGLGGYVLSALLGFWLIISIIKSKKM